MAANNGRGVMEHWKFFAAMTLVSASTFQYGLDFGAINGLQAMVPFLQASRGSNSKEIAPPNAPLNVFSSRESNC